MKKIAVIIPTYKEKENIAKLIKKIFRYLPNSKIFIIDDSPQSMANILKVFGKNVKYIHRKFKKGRGSAVLDGLNISLNEKKFEAFLEMDADFSHNPREIPKKINYFNKKKLDLLISSRYLKQSKILNWSLSRRIFSLASNFLAKNLLRVKVSDYTNGFRIYSKRSAKLISKNCGNIGDGFIVLSEILLTINQKKFKIGELPTIFINRKRGESSVNFKLILHSLYGLIKLGFIKHNILKNTK